MDALLGSRLNRGGARRIGLQRFFCLRP
jgi:hypothetical protein